MGRFLRIFIFHFLSHPDFVTLQLSPRATIGAEFATTSDCRHFSPVALKNRNLPFHEWSRGAAPCVRQCLETGSIHVRVGERSMRYGKFEWAFLAVVSGTTLFVPSQPCQAGPIIDWLFHRNQTYYAQPIYAPPTYVQPAATAAPAVNYAGACTPCNTCQRVASCYQPEPYYRTTWAQMPVTNYRPVITNNPAVGYPVTTYQPCQTSIWQARRLPSYGVFYPTTAAFAPVANSGCSSCGASTSAPYYAPGAPATTFGPTTIAPGTSLPRTIIPGSSSPAAGGAAVPADTQPSLSPTGLPGAAPPTIRNFTPLDSVTPPLDPPGGLQLNSPAAVQKKTAPDSRLRFVPDPEAPASPEDTNRAPRLLTPREKTAATSLRQNWASTPIPWSEPSAIRAASAEIAIPVKPKSPPATEEKWDDSGWRSLRP